MSRTRWIALPDEIKEHRLPLIRVAAGSGLTQDEVIGALLRWLWWLNGYGRKGAGVLNREAVASLMRPRHEGSPAALLLVANMEREGWIEFDADGHAVPVIDGHASLYLLRKIRVAGARAQGRHTKAQWLALVAEAGGACPRCQRTCAAFEKDHVIRLADYGSDNIDNLQPLCHRCNTSKTTETINWLAVRRAERGLRR